METLQLMLILSVVLGFLFGAERVLQAWLFPVKVSYKMARMINVPRLPNLRSKKAAKAAAAEVFEVPEEATQAAVKHSEPAFEVVEKDDGVQAPAVEWNEPKWAKYDEPTWKRLGLDLSPGFVW